MESSPIIPQDKPLASCGIYRVIRGLGHGFTSIVKLVVDSQTGKQYALKILKEGITKPIQRELEVLCKITHPNMVNMREYLPDIDYISKDGTQRKTVTAMVLELCEGGDLIDILYHTGKFTEPLVRFYFHQLVNCLEHLHTSGYTHRDLKPENLLLTKDYSLKVADFGFSTLIAGATPDGLLITPLGTPAYMAPEILKCHSYSGVAVDVFALGVILFILFAGVPPFNRADASDQYYDLITKKKLDYFWYIHSKHRGNSSYFPESFKDLINKLLAFSPSDRPDTTHIKSHDWYNGELPQPEEVFEEMSSRHQILKLKKEKDAADKEAEALKKHPHQPGAMITYPKTKGARESLKDVLASLSSTFPTLDEKRIVQPYDKRIDDKVPLGFKTTDYFCSETVQDTLLTLVYVLHEQKYHEITLHKTKYKVTAQVEVGGIQIRFSCRILNNNDVTSHVTFKRLLGPLTHFHDVIRVLRERLDKVISGHIEP